MTGGHSPACAAAVRTTKCKCACDGAFHGGPHSDRARALLRRGQKKKEQIKYSGGQVSKAKTKARKASTTNVEYGKSCTGFAVTFAVDRFILGADSKEQGLVSDALCRVTTPFVDEIAGAALAGADSRNIQTAVEGLHILCALCAAVLEAVDQVKKLSDEAADAVSEQVIVSLGNSPLLTIAVRATLKLALRRSFGVLIDLAVNPAQIKSIQLLGFISCPDISDHPEVERYCVKPLAVDYMNDSVEAWIGDEFPRGSRVLDGSPGRRRN